MLRWKRLQAALGNMDEFVEKVNREPQGQDMFPTVTISDIAGLGHLHLLKHLCSLFAFVPRAEHVCVYTHAYLCGLCCFLFLFFFFCVCVCECLFR